MTRFLLFLFFIASCTHFSAQIITTNPSIATSDQPVVVTFYADRGTGGLKNFIGDVYAHTGVITNKSTSDSDWRYAKANWQTNKPECKLTRVSANVYTLSVSPSVREFYGVPEGEEILKMAIVFRSSDGSNEGKESGGKDIFVQVYKSELTVSFEQPAKEFFYVKPSESVNVKVNALFNDDISLYLDNNLIATESSSTLNHVFIAPTGGRHELKAVATAGSKRAEVNSVFVVAAPTVTEPIPLVDYRRGFNRISDSEGILVLFAPYKNMVYAAGDFNDWQPDGNYQMKREGSYYWIRLQNLDPEKEYAYQYWIDGDIRIADPYTNKILDPWNDKYIPESVYPNLKPYPSGKTDNLVSVLSTKISDFQWKSNLFESPKTKELVIYELLIRDFTAKKDINTVTDSIGYLKQLGVNAIELMPFNEFEGNDSWGYNPSLYFAPDKAYGTADDYKRFVDVCHQNGIAVIMDMVLNHSFGQSPLVQMYMDSSKPSGNNPWYNREHNMKNPDAQWGFDFNHESSHTQELVDSVCSFWMSEFRIDGFRFDFTKGFTNTPYPATNGDIWASSYDASRIRILKRMTDQIWKRKADAIVIFEHLSDNVEEAELANHGILLWGNLNHSYNQSTMGFGDGSDFSWGAWNRRPGWNKPNLISYMESHDEERLMYKNLMYGKVNGDYSAREMTTALRRMEAAAVLYFAIPGPKMIWQFGEMGYDVSIDQGGRTSPKPPKWNYLSVPARKQLFDVYSNLIRLKKSEAAFSTDNFSVDAASLVKRISIDHPDGDIRIVANFDTKSNPVQPRFSQTGWWYDHFKGDSLLVSNLDMTIYSGPGAYHLFSQKKMEGFRVITSSKPDATITDKMVLFPNPATDIVYVSTGSNSPKMIRVTTLAGDHLIVRPTSNETEQISVGNLSAGVYLIQVDQSGKPMVWKKLIKR